MKKLISILLVVMLLASVSATAFACCPWFCPPPDPYECMMQQTIKVLQGPQLKWSGNTGTFDLGSGSSDFCLTTHTLSGLKSSGMKTLTFIVDGKSFEMSTEELLELFAGESSLTTHANNGKLDLLNPAGTAVTTLEAVSEE